MKNSKTILFGVGGTIFFYLLLQIFPGGGIVKSLFVSTFTLILFTTLIIAAVNFLYISFGFLYQSFMSITKVSSNALNVMLDALNEALGSNRSTTGTRVKLVGFVTSVMTRITGIRYSFSAIADSLVMSGFVIDAQSLQEQSLIAFDEFLRSNRQRTSPERPGLVAGYFVRAFFAGLRLLKVTASYCLALLKTSSTDECHNDGTSRLVEAGIQSMLGDTRALLSALHALSSLELPSSENIPLEMRIEKSGNPDWFEADSQKTSSRRGSASRSTTASGSSTKSAGASSSFGSAQVETNPEDEMMKKVAAKLKPFVNSNLFRLKSDYDEDCCPLKELGSLAKISPDSNVVLKFNFLFKTANSGGALQAFSPFYPANFNPLSEMERVATYATGLNDHSGDLFELDMATSSLTVTNEIADLILGVKLADILKVLAEIKDKSNEEAVDCIDDTFGGSIYMNTVILLYCRYLRALAEVTIRAKNAFSVDGYDTSLYEDAYSAVIVLHLSLSVSAPSSI